jgi:hypothetical protein
MKTTEEMTCSPVPAGSVPVSGSDLYRVDVNGQLWRRCVKGSKHLRKTGPPIDWWRPVNGHVTRNGYRSVTIRVNGEQVKRFVHVIVLESFVGPKPGFDSCHANGNRLDNRLANLRWDTRKGNMADSIRHGTTRRGEKNPFAKLNASQVIEIRGMIADGIPQSAIATRFGICQQTVSNINVRTWRHIT